MHLNRDCVHLLLQSLSPKSALMLRATNRHYNNIISNAQTYWFYQLKVSSVISKHTTKRGSLIRYKGLLGKTRRSDQESREISGQRSVHIKPMTTNCVRYRPGNHHLLQQLMDKYAYIRLEHQTLLQDKHSFEEFVNKTKRMYFNHYGSDEWWQQRYETDVAEKILSRHLQEVQTLPNVTCRTPGHCIVVYNDDPVIGLQRSTQASIDENGLYMFHYLIERFQQVKKLHQKTTASDATIENLQVQIQIRKQQIAALREQLWIQEHYDELADDIKTCPFVRSRPQTYHKKAKYLAKVEEETDTKPNKRTKRS